MGRSFSRIKVANLARNGLMYVLDAWNLNARKFISSIEAVRQFALH